MKTIRKCLPEMRTLAHCFDAGKDRTVMVRLDHLGIWLKLAGLTGWRYLPYGTAYTKACGLAAGFDTGPRPRRRGASSNRVPAAAAGAS